MTCTRVESKINPPNSRWGHAAVVHEESKLIILGGRNENDVTDIHCFDVNQGRWFELKIGIDPPKPRRRHSVVLISNCLVMFGGFDGDFFDDLNVLYLTPDVGHLEVEPSSKCNDLLKLINADSNYDMSIQVCSESCFKEIKACKALFLYRTLDRETSKVVTYQDSKTKSVSSFLDRLNHQNCPVILKEVFKLKHRETLIIKPEFVTGFEYDLERAFVALVRLIGFLYTDRFPSAMTISEANDMHTASKSLGLEMTALRLENLLKPIFQNIKGRFIKDMQVTKYQIMS